MSDSSNSSNLRMRERVLSFLPNDIEDDLEHVDRRWRIRNSKSFGPILPEYANIIDRKILFEDKKKEEDFIFVNARYEAEDAAKKAPLEFNKDLTFSEFSAEHYFVIEEIQKDQIVFNYEEEAICSYGGLHWTNLEGLLFVIFEGFSTKSQEFLDLSELFRHDKSIPIPWHSVHADIIRSGFKTFLESLFKDPHRFIIRYLVLHQDEIVHRDGMKYLVPGIEDIMNLEMLSEINQMLYERIQATPLMDEVMCVSDIPPVRDNIRMPPDRPSLQQSKDKVIDFGAITGGGILCYKVVYDYTSDKIRMNPSDQPYVDAAYYDPPITRGVKKTEQPFRFVLANAKIDMNDLDGDTVNMRKVVTADQLTAALDWAVKNGKPLPKLGTEFYIHLGDGVSERMAASKILMCAYARKRSDSEFIIPFPDYSYQVFALNTRFHIRESHSMTWNHIRDHIVKTSREILPKDLKDRDRTIFFRGNEFDFIGIRKSMFYLQKSNINFRGKTIIEKGDMKIEIPKLTEGASLTPMGIPDMAKNAILPDLPGYGMWSTRLKFVCLTRSYVPRVMFLDKNWDKADERWTEPDPKGDLWETFTDSYLPIEFTHTIIGPFYRGYFTKEDCKGKESFAKNNQSKLQIMEKIGIIQKDITKPKYQKKVDEIYERVVSLNQDHINEYIYELIMKQARYYGFM